MKYSFIALMTGSLVTMSGCESFDSQMEPKAEQTHHASQAVYEVEFAAAQQFYRQTELLSQSFADYCTAPTQEAREVRQQWHQTMLSWMALQGQERGPAVALEQSWNVQFWPDKKNTTGVKMSVLTRREQSWSVDEIAVQSVTVQGLGALEWLLYDSQSNLAQNPQTCDTGVAIAGNLKRNAAKIATAWQSNPWVALDDKEWRSEYISLLSNQLEYAMKKMARPLANIGQPRPYFAESWRSETSFSNLKANIEALRQLYVAHGHGLDAMLREMGKQDLADRVLNQFDTMLATWPQERSLFSALATKDGYRLALAQYYKLEQLKYVIHDEVAVELGVVIGFNATDGD